MTRRRSLVRAQYSPLSSLATTFDSPVHSKPKPKSHAQQTLKLLFAHPTAQHASVRYWPYVWGSCWHMPRTQPRSLESQVCRQENVFFHLQRRQPHAEQRWWNWYDPPLFKSAIYPLKTTKLRQNASPKQNSTVVTLKAFQPHSEGHFVVCFWAHISISTRIDLPITFGVRALKRPIFAFF